MIYTFGEFTLDRRSLRLLRGGVVIGVQPRILELLLYLVEHRERLLTKQELIETVWRGEPVSDAALARGVFEARRTLGDDSRQPRYVHTVHGRGYRFGGVVHEHESSTPFDPPFTSGASAVIRTTSRPCLKVPADRPLDGGTASRNSREATADAKKRTRGSRETEGRSRGRVVTGRGAWRWRVATAAGALVALLVLAVAWRQAPAQRGVDAPVVRVAILPLSPTTPSSATEATAAAFADLLARTLAASSTLIVRDPNLAATVALQESSLAAVAARLEVQVVVSGSIQAEPPYRTELVVHDLRVQPGTVAILDRQFVPPLTDDRRLGTLVAAARAVLADLASTLGVAALRPAPGILPASAEAYTLYVLARRWLSREGCELAATVDALERSVSADPRFAPAWAALAETHIRLAGPCLFPGSHMHHALAAAQRSLREGSGWHEPRRLLGRIHAQRGDPAAAFEAMRSGSRHPRLAAEQAAILLATGLTEEAESLLENALRRDPAALSELQDGPEAVLLPPEVLRYFQPLSWREAYLSAHMSLLDGDTAGAVARWQSHGQGTPEAVYARLAAALVALSEGDTDEAAAIIRHLAHHRDLTGARDGGTDLLLAQLLLLAGETTSAMALLHRAVEGGWTPVVLLQTHPAFESARLDPDFPDLLRLAEERRREFRRRLGRGPLRPP